ncbi:SUN domain-containing protein 1 isoform X4 [Dromiciops gliroides]|uniref:SUN domain-containing protein 1 isoform X4 n=1 Tax=Dromiciops gliroides TaxID=33562 RepID=UPI001CC4C35E|nr:SUN domain-containing protein 1 isoform X4 [Dromiciops gliroides]XP_043834450.1 SUN domain-containing protein 1 isoform X4 [Dromiciops gliroides]XP_043834451.1 SUN domain-containing protein 1 isoform X4 [Dromiciops gliroides]
MDFSRLHTYTPPQSVPENTGYTYGLRLSRRSLHSVPTTYTNDDGQMESTPSYTRNTSQKDMISKSSKHHRNTNKQSLAINHTARKAASNSSLLSQSTLDSHASDTSLRSSVLDESLIRKQTKVVHFWGLDDDGDLKGGTKTVIQGNGDLATEGTDTTLNNGYICSDCSMLSERKDVLTAYSTSHVPSSRIYFRDGSQKRGASLYMNRIFRLAKHTAASFSSLLVQLFQVVLMKFGYESENYKLKNYDSKDCESKSYKTKSHESKAHSNYCGCVNVKEFLREDGHLSVNGESLCDDCKGKKHLETYTTTHLQSSRSKRVARTIWHTFSYTGYFLMQTLQRIGATGWFVSKKVLSFLWLAIVSPGKAASGVFWWLGTGWYQFVTLISWLNVFLLTRCLPKICKLLLLLIPLLLLLGIGLYLWNMESFLSLLPIFNWTSIHRSQRIDESRYLFKPDSSHVNQPTEMDFMAFQQENEFRILKLEDLLGKLSEKDKLIQEELDQTKSRIISGVDERQHLLSQVKNLELELGHLKSELLTWQSLKTSCEKVETMHEKVDTQIRETIKFMFSNDQQDGSLEWLLQWLSSKFVSKGDLQTLLRDLELQILKNITLHMSMTKQIPTSETLVNADSVGISGITEAVGKKQARIIVNNALKLYSQDKTGMVDFALESGGGSILSTRCSETYETQTALISVFGIPLWYHSQSPRIVIQPDIYPGNCWAFKGSQGYLVVRLSMMIYPTAFTIEHIPKTLSPTGNITSAPKDFSVYGLDSEYQEEGMLLGQFVYDQEGESLQIFQAMKSPGKAFQIVELRIFSNWGHPEYTCLYRFRVHGELIK